MNVAAMMTYYAVLALFPMLLFVVMVALLVVPVDALALSVAMTTRALPGEVGALIGTEVIRMKQAADGGFALTGAPDRAFRRAPALLLASTNVALPAADTPAG